MTAVRDLRQEQPETNPTKLELQRLMARQQAAFRANPNPDLRQRQDRLRRLEKALKQHAPALCDAVNQDFGRRSSYETRLLEIFPSLDNIRHVRRRLRGWMRPKRRSTSLWFWPARSKVVFQPRGVVGIIVPWNYPIYLAISPLVSAIAAGNRVLLSCSEHTPATAAVLKSLLASVFSDSEVAVLTEGAETAKVLTTLPLDHLLFTGNTKLGREVMRTASENLTSLTLELGGKCPTILGPEAEMIEATPRIFRSKLMNAGQTCVAPDYVLVPHAQISSFVEHAKFIVPQLYPDVADNADYTAIINAKHFRRLQDLLADAMSKGAEIVDLRPIDMRDKPLGKHRIPPLLVINPSPDMHIMQQEIFGPILPVMGYETLAEAIHFVNTRPRPLALYYFGHNRTHQQQVLTQTVSGGVTLNDTVLHVAQSDLPFGGVGESGIGRYHGREGFETFSNQRSILKQGPWSSANLLAPPYGKLANLLLKFMIR